MRNPFRKIVRFISAGPALRLSAGTLIAAILLTTFSALAQQQQPPASSPSNASPKTSAATNSDSNSKSQPENTVKNDRLFGVIPNYTTVETEDKFGPLTPKGKFKLAVDSSFDPYTFPFIGFIALVGQAENSEPSYGQGLKGY